MTSDFNDAHQLKISKLQERLGSISSDLRKKAAKDTQKDFGSLYRSSALTRDRENEFQSKLEKELVENEILQKIKLQEEYETLEMKRIVENQQVIQEELKRLETVTSIENQEPRDVFQSKKSEESDLGQIANKQKVMQESKSWQPWKPIPKEKLLHLDKKTLSKFFKKH